MINRILHHPKVKDNKVVEFCFKAAIVIGFIVVAVMVVGDLTKAWQSDKAVDDKKHCLGKFDTVVCHQLRIQQLLLESRQKELLEAK